MTPKQPLDEKFFCFNCVRDDYNLIQHVKQRNVFHPYQLPQLEGQDQVRTYCVLNQTKDWFMYKHSKHEDVHISVFEEPWKITAFEDKVMVLREVEEEPTKWEQELMSHPNAFMFYPF